MPALRRLAVLGELGVEVGVARAGDVARAERRASVGAVEPPPYVEHPHGAAVGVAARPDGGPEFSGSGEDAVHACDSRAPRPRSSSDVVASVVACQNPSSPPVGCARPMP